MISAFLACGREGGATNLGGSIKLGLESWLLTVSLSRSWVTASVLLEGELACGGFGDAGDSLAFPDVGDFGREGGETNLGDVLFGFDFGGEAASLR